MVGSQKVFHKRLKSDTSKLGKLFKILLFGSYEAYSFRQVYFITNTDNLLVQLVDPTCN